MSPAKTTKTTKAKKPVGLGRDRSEIFIAVVVGVGIALVTAILVWALRPGPTGVRGSGGIMTRQPRVFLWLAIFVAVGAWVIYWVLNGRRRPKKVSRGTAVAIASVIVAVAAIVVAIVWPGGFLRHYQSFKPPDTPPVTEPTGTTTPGSSTPGSTTPVTTTPPTSATP